MIVTTKDTAECAGLLIDAFGSTLNPLSDLPPDWFGCCMLWSSHRWCEAHDVVSLPPWTNPHQWLEIVR